MNQPDGMSGANPLARIDHRPRGVAHRQAAELPQAIRQAAAGHIFQDQEGAGVVFADFVDRDHIGMAELACRLGLGGESSERRRIVHQIIRDHLDGHHALNQRIARLEHDAHRALAENPLDQVFACSFADPVLRVGLPLRIRRLGSRVTARHTFDQRRSTAGLYSLG